MWFDVVLAPARAAMQRMKLPVKLGLLSGLSIVPLLIVTWLAMDKIGGELAMTRNELDGAVMLDATIAAVRRVQDHRGTANLAHAGNTTAVAALPQARAALASALDALERAAARRPELGIVEPLQPIRQALDALAAQGAGGDGRAVFAGKSEQILKLRELALLVAERLGLLLEPDPVPYFLMDVPVQRLIPWMEALATIRGQGAGLLARGDSKPTERAALIAALGRVDDAVAAARFASAAIGRAAGRSPASLDAAREATDRFIAVVRQAFESENASTVDGATFFEAGSAALRALDPYGKETVDALTGALRQRLSKLQTQRAVVVAVLVLAVLFLGYLLAGFHTSFVGALHKVHRAVHEAASGNLVPSVSVRGSDELAQTVQRLETMNTDLSRLIAGVRSNAVMVTNIGSGLAESTADLSSQAEQQAASLEQTNASLQEISQTVAQTADHAHQLDRHATTVRETAERGSEAMREAVEAIRSVQSNSAKIHDIVSLIESIAFQTNILALNAAVEAARAGEHGRGFAVVASEVRTLAQSSAASAREIAALVQTTVDSVQGASECIEQVNDKLAGMVGDARNLVDTTQSIASAAAGEARGLQQISQAMAQLDELTQRTATMAERSRTASSDLQYRAVHLNRALTVFHLRQGSADEAIALVERARPMAGDGAPASLTRITADASLRDRDMYVFVFDRQGIYRAFAGNPARVGVALSTIPGLDAPKLVRDAFDAAAMGSGWVDYQIIHPASGRVEPKTSFVVPVGPDLVLGCGVYRGAFAEA